MLHSISQQIWKIQQWPQDWKRSTHILIPKRGSTKEHSSHQTIVLISNASRVMFKILQAKLQNYLNWEFPDVQAGFRKGRWTRDQIANTYWIIKKARKFQKNTYFCLIGKIVKRREYQTTLPGSWEIGMHVKKQQSELDME